LGVLDFSKNSLKIFSLRPVSPSSQDLEKERFSMERISRISRERSIFSQVFKNS